MSSCPSVAELAALLAESEGTPARAELEAHLSECADCQNALLGLADDTGEWNRVQLALKKGFGNRDDSTGSAEKSPGPRLPSALLGGWKETLRRELSPGDDSPSRRLTAFAR